MGKFVDRTGIKYNKLLVLELDKQRSTKRRKFWLCKCDCGTTKSINADGLKSGGITSCGCVRRENWHKVITKHDHLAKHKRLVLILIGMKQRCYNENDKFHYKYYGGRGIAICDEWLDKENGVDNFVKWALANGYKKNLTIDRIDNNGNYEPSNCRWITHKEQMSNTRSVVLIEHNGETHSVSYLAHKFGTNPGTARRRFKQGWTFEQVFSKLDRRRKENKIEKEKV